MNGEPNIPNPVQFPEGSPIVKKRSPFTLLVVGIGILGLVCGGAACGLASVRRALNAELRKDGPVVKQMVTDILTDYSKESVYKHAKGSREVFGDPVVLSAMLSGLKTRYGKLRSVGDPIFRSVVYNQTSDGSEGSLLGKYKVPVEFERDRCDFLVTIKKRRAGSELVGLHALSSKVDQR